MCIPTHTYCKVCGKNVDGYGTRYATCCIADDDWDKDEEDDDEESCGKACEYEDYYSFSYSFADEVCVVEAW